MPGPANNQTYSRTDEVGLRLTGLGRKLPAGVDLRRIILLGGLVIDGGSAVAFAAVHLHHRS